MLFESIANAHLYNIIVCIKNSRVGNCSRSHSLNLLFSHTGVTIGFPLGQTLNVTEGNENTISVCPEILEGVLERAVTVFASTSNMTATGQLLTVGDVNQVCASKFAIQ